MSAVRLDGASITLGRRNILSQVSFAIEPGEFVAVMGPNGAGKTTLMRAILGLVPVSGGRIEVLGASPRRGNAAIGYMPQSRRSAAQTILTGADFLLSGQGGNRWGLPFATAAARAEV
ncbi:MAG: ATP-binding cassette domain-containing protein, partial [Devosia sp.]